MRLFCFRFVFDLGKNAFRIDIALSVKRATMADESIARFIIAQKAFVLHLKWPVGGALALALTDGRRVWRARAEPADVAQWQPVAFCIVFCFLH